MGSCGSYAQEVNFQSILGFQFGRKEAIEEVARSRAALPTGVALVLLTGIALYGLLSYRLVLRTREIGIRIALGARRSEVVGMVLKEGSSKIDPVKVPKTIDYALTVKGLARPVVTQGIYEFDKKDAFRICASLSAKGRPWAPLLKAEPRVLRSKILLNLASVN